MQRVLDLLNKAKATVGYEDVQVIAELYVNGRRYTGSNRWASRAAKAEGSKLRGDKFARNLAKDLDMLNPTTKKVPHGAFLNHAEGNTLFQAYVDGVKGGRATLVVTRAPCDFCRSGLSSLKSILHLDELVVYYKSANGGIATRLY